jgi:hypothetical protein
MKRNGDIEVLSGQLVAQNMMLHMLLGQNVLTTADAGAGLRGSHEAAIDTIDQIRALAGANTR